MPGLFSPDTLIASFDGSLTYNTRVDNITSPSVLADLGIAASDVEELIFNRLLGNWTCVLQNDVGTAIVQYLVHENRKCMQGEYVPSIVILACSE